MDKLSRERRSEIMARIHQPTGLEARVHRWLDEMGIEHEMYPKIESRPDIRVGSLYVFVDGCFWHACPLHYREPKSSSAGIDWRAKIAGNVERDRRRESLPYKWLRIWEHQVRSGEFKEIVLRALGGSR